MNEKFFSFFSKYGLIIVIIIAIFFRFFNLSITPPGLYPDEAMDGTNAQEALSTGHYKVFYPENNGREGLFINIQAFLLKIFNTNQPWVLRSLSAFFGVITVIGIYLFVRKIFRRHLYADFMAFLPAFFTATSFWHINFSRISFRAIMAPAFLVWAAYLIICSLEKIRENDQKSNSKSQINSNYQNSESDPKQKKSWNLGFGAWFLSILGGLVYGLGMHSYIAYRATPVIVMFIYALYWFLYKPNAKKLILSFVVFVIASLAVFSPLGIYFIKNPADFFGRTSELSITASASPLKDLALNTIKTLGMFNVRGDGNWRHNYSGAPEVYWFVGIFFVMGIILGAIRAIRKIKNHAYEDEDVLWLISIVWILIAMLPVVISNEGIPHALRSLLMIPAVFMIAGIGAFAAVSFVSKYIKPNMLYVILVIIGIGLIVQVYCQYFILWGNNPNVAGAFNQNYVNIGNQINAISPAIPKYVVVNAGGVLVRGIPMPSQTVMFITDTFTADKQAAKNVHYVSPDQESTIPKNALVFYLEPEQVK